MALQGHGLRLLAGLLGLSALASLTPAAAEGKLTKPERRAVDIRSVTGASTSTAMLAEIRFAGNLDDALGRRALRKALVKVELLTASGQTTVITERGSERRPRHGRTGTAGSFEVIRHGRSLLLLVEGLTEPVRQAVVSTGTGAAVAAQDGAVFEELLAPIHVLEYQEAIRLERERVDQQIKATEEQIKLYEEVSEILHKQNQMWQKRLEDAQAPWQRKRAREEIEAGERALRNVAEEQGRRRKELKALRRWRDIINQPIRVIVVIPLS